MSMLAHGFVDHDADDGFALDDSDPVIYSVVRLRAAPLRVGAAVVLVVVLLAFVAAIVVA